MIGFAGTARHDPFTFGGVDRVQAEAVGAKGGHGAK
jgi:hypothetical protein